MRIVNGSRADYNRLIVARDRTWSVSVRVRDDNGVLQNSIANRKVKSITIDESATDGNDIMLGTFVTSKVNLSFIDMTGTEASILYAGKRFRLVFTLGSYGASTTVMVETDEYVVDKAKFDKGLKTVAGSQEQTYHGSVVAYDLSYLLTRDFSIALTGNATTATGKAFLEAVAGRYSFISDVTSAAKTAASVASFAPLADYNDRQTVCFMAGCFGKLAKITSGATSLTRDNNYIDFTWYTTQEPAIDANTIFEGAAHASEMEPRTIAMIETGTSDSPIVKPDSASGYSINYENPYITEVLADAVATALGLSSGSVTYRLGKVKYKGSLLHEAGTTVSVSDISGDSVTMYVMRRQVRYDGGLSCTIECLGDSESTIAWKQTSPTLQRINRLKSRLEEAIKKATDVISQTRGSIFEFVPRDPSDPSQGNAGWILRSAISDNRIVANSSGIGFSSNGGASFNAAAIYIDENGVGRINGDFITAGTISADRIDTTSLVIGNSNLDQNLQNTISGASSNASAAVSTANAASAAATNAQTAAAAADLKVAAWCHANDTTMIDGGKIYTGSISADNIAAGAVTVEKLSVGWSGGNYASSDSGQWSITPTGKIVVEKDSSTKLPKMRMNSNYSSGTVSCIASSFYAAAGTKILYKANVYVVGSDSSNVSVCLAKKNNNNTITLLHYKEITDRNTVKSVDESYTVSDNGYYCTVLYFNNCNSGTYVTNLSMIQSVSGEMIVNGKIKSTDGNTYFDLNTAEIATVNGNYKSTYDSAELKFLDYSQTLGAIRGYVENANKRLLLYSPNIIELGIGSTADEAIGHGAALYKSGLEYIFNVNGNLTANGLGINGPAAIDGIVGIQGAVTINNTLDVSGQVTLYNTKIRGYLTGDSNGFIDLDKGVKLRGSDSANSLWRELIHYRANQDDIVAGDMNVLFRVFSKGNNISFASDGIYVNGYRKLQF